MGIGNGGERDKLYLRHRKALVEYARPLVGSRQEAEDVVQEAYLRFVPETEDKAPVAKSYLFMIVRNLSFNRRSRRKREHAIHPDDIPWWAQPQSIETPESDLLFCEQVKAASLAIESLPEKARLVVSLYRFEGLTLSEIAVRLQTSVPTVHRLLQDAMEAIKAQMTRDQ